jgi:hypothetical protein
MIRGRGLLLAVLAILAAGLPACTDASLTRLPPPPPPVPDNKITVNGEVCTQDPEDLDFPLRVVFLVDCSESMEVNDPPDPETQETGREKAVRETVEELLTSGGDVKVSVVRFSSESQPLTAELDQGNQVVSYFSDDLDYILSRIPLLGENDRTTNYIRALSEAYAEIRHELMHSTQESLALSTYHVIMITDGLPDVEGDETLENSSENIIDAVDALMELGRIFHVSTITLNTALLATGNSQVDSVAEALLQDMAEAGNGTFRSFESGGELNFLYVDLTTLKRVFTLRTLVAQNGNSVVRGDEALPDSDGDGLDDFTELAVGSNPLTPDSDGDGCRDGVEHRHRNSGMDPLDPGDCECFVPDYCFREDPLDLTLPCQCDGFCIDLNDNGLCDCDGAPEGSCCADEDGDPLGECDPGSCCQDEDGDGLCDCIDDDDDGICDPANYIDEDGDGLVDCEERYSGTNRAGPDSDGDGLVDFLELRFGTSADIDDVANDLDWDLVPNGEEVRTATDPRHASSQGRYQLAYRYTVDEQAMTSGSTCYSFEVSNITLTEVVADAPPTVGPAAQGYSGWNRVLIYAGEVPFDDLASYARFRVACVEARYWTEVDKNGEIRQYKSPPSGNVTLYDNEEQRDFVDLAAFDPAVDCIRP